MIGLYAVREGRSMSLATRTIALAEGRQLEELAQMLEKESATVLRCPLVSILDPLDDGPMLGWLGDLVANRFDLVILFTGEGLRRFVACADRHGLRDQVLTALGRTRLLTRGPKPVRALRDVGLAPALIAPAPTTEGVIAALKTEPLQGKTVGVQLYSASNPPLTQFLVGAGHIVRTVQPYVYAPAADRGPGGGGSLNRWTRARWTPSFSPGSPQVVGSSRSPGNAAPMIS